MLLCILVYLYSLNNNLENYDEWWLKLWTFDAEIENRSEEDGNKIKSMNNETREEKTSEIIIYFCSSDKSNEKCQVTQLLFVVEYEKTQREILGREWRTTASNFH